MFYQRARIVVDEMQQFCSVIAFSSEMPLPVPIQVDRLENRVRMAFVRWDFETKQSQNRLEVYGLNT